MFYLVDSGPVFAGLASPNAGWIVVDHKSFRFWISCVVSEIFAIKVGSWVKSTKILRHPEFLDFSSIIKLTQI